MGQKPRTIAIMPLRGGSKSIPLKNIKLIAGKPLAIWGLEAACNSESVEEIIVATDSKEIEDTINNYMLHSSNSRFSKVKFYRRSLESSTDYAPTEMVVNEVIERFECDYFFLIQATSPLLTKSDLDNGYRHFIEGGYDSLLSGVRQKRFIWKNEADEVRPQNYDYTNRPMRQEFDGFLVENGAFYICTKAQFTREQCRLFGKIGFYEMDEITYLELDEVTDWIVVEKILLLQTKSESDYYNNLKKIKMLVLDCDGVLTDGKMYYDSHGEVMKVFDTRDGMGLQKIREKGIEVAIISGESNDIIKSRAKKLGINRLYLGSKNKIRDMEELLHEVNLELSEIAYIGDDINDIELLEKVGVSFTPQDGIEKVQHIVDVVLKAKGGAGAVREVCDMILDTLTIRK